MASARPRLWVTARLQVSAPGQATTSRDSSAPGSAMPMASSRWWSSGSWSSDEAAEHEVLPVGDAHLGAELPLDRGEGPELVGGDVAEAGVGDGRDGALGHAADDVGVVPRLVRVVAAERAPACPGRSGWAVPSAEAGGRVAVLLRPSPGCRRARWSEATRNLRSLRMRACSSSQPIVSTSHFMRARSLLSRLPWFENTRRIASMRGEQLLAGRELLEGERRVRVGAEAAGDEHPEAGLAGAVVERAGGGDHADVVEHRLAAVGLAAGEVDLELAGQALGERVVEEVLERGLGPRADVERLVGAGAGEVAAHDVADGVAARLPRGEADRGQVAQHGGDLLEVRRSGTGCSAGW